MNKQQRFWKNEYSLSYIEKNNSFNNEKGFKAWSLMLNKSSDINSILECGCNIGRNIFFLDKIKPDAKKSIIEISPDAFSYVKKTYKLESAQNSSIVDSSLNNTFDLVFTMGVLIHIHPKELLSNLNKIYEYSKKYILVGEYFNRTPTSIIYQGQKDLLFKRDFGKVIIENFKLELVDYGFLWGHEYDDAGFDDFTWWLFKKN